MNTKEIDRRIPSPLRLHHPLQPREAATGFASRLAAVNGRHLTELLRHRNLAPWDVDRGDPDAIRFVAAIGSVDPDQLLHQTIRPAGADRRWEVAGESFGPNGINRTFFRYCPHCVLDDIRDVYGPEAARPWLRIEWTLNHYRACHIHHAFLIAAEPTRRRFAPFDFNETVAALRPQLEDIAASTEPYRASPYHEWIVGRLEGRTDPTNWLDRLSLHAGAAWCENLGISALHPPKIPPGKLSRLDRAIAADEGFRIASAGEDAIRMVFHRLTNAEKRSRGILGPRDTYGYAFGLLQKTMDDAAFEPLRNLVRDYAMHALPWKIGTDMLGVTIEEHAVVSVTTAAQAAGADRKTIRKIFKRKGIATEDIESGYRNHRVTVPSGEIETTLRKLKGALSLPATLELLGIDRSLLEALVEVSLLPDASGAAPEFQSHRRFAREDINAMLARLFEGAADVETPAERQVPMMRARHLALASHVEILRFILDGKLTWKGRLAGRSDLGALLLDADECIQLVRALAPPMENFLFADLEEAITGLNKNSVPFLVKLKKLDEDEEFSPRARRLVPVITRASVEEFRRQYVTAGELCQAHGLHHKQVRSILDRVGIEEEFDAKAVKTTIYDRGSVDAAAAGEKGFWVYRK